MSDNHRYWWAVLYPENMLHDWENKIDDLIQLPYAYCKHNLDIDSQSDHRKDHIHLIIAFNNTTTYKHAFNTFAKLNDENQFAFNKIEACSQVRYCYNYLIHDTESCRKAGKHLYSVNDRITGNNFDIGSFEQLSLADKQRMRNELSNFILDSGCDNYSIFYQKVAQSISFDDSYLDIICSYSSHFERLCKGNYLINAYIRNH